MSDDKVKKDPPTGSGRQLRTGNAWADALKELESSAPVTASPVAQPTPPPKAAPAPRPQPGDSLKEIIRRMEKAENDLDTFEKAHPYLIAPNIIRLWEVHLRESVVMLTRELERLEGEAGN